MKIFNFYCPIKERIKPFNLLGEHMQGLHKIERSNVTSKYSFDIVKKILIISVFYNSIHV